MKDDQRLSAVRSNTHTANIVELGVESRSRRLQEAGEQRVSGNRADDGAQATVGGEWSAAGSR